MNLLPAIRAGAARIGLPKIFGGATAGSAVTPGGRSVATRARFSGTVNWTATVTGSDGARVRTWSGRGSAMAVGWNGRSGSGAATPAGWATMTVTVRSGSSFARPVVSAVYVRRATPLGGTTTGAFARGNWALTTRNVDQERPRSFIRVSFGRQPGDVPVVGDWDGNGSVTPGVLRAGARWYLRNTVGGGAANLGLRKQVAGTPVVGDFDGAP
jgi:hypothetical protein